MQMIRCLRGLAAFVLLALCAPVFAASAPPEFPPPGFWSTPTIQGYGRIHYVPDAAYQPDPKATYKLVFAVNKAPNTPQDVNPQLDHVARAINLYVAAGVPLSHIKAVAIVYGGATPLVLDNAHYRDRYLSDNPNKKLIEELRHAGVDVAVCAQSMGEHHFPFEWKSEHVTLALSGLTTILNLQTQGYALMP